MAFSSDKKIKFILLSLCVILLCQSVRGLQLPLGKSFYFESTNTSPPKVAEEDVFAPENPEIFNTSEYRTENGSALPPSKVENSSLKDQNSSESTTDGQSSTHSSSSSSDATTSTQTSSAAFGNESQSQNASLVISNVPYNGAGEGNNSSETFNVTASLPSNESNEDEQEGVVRGKPSTTESSNTTSQPQNLYQKTWALISDTYTLSILVPVAAGVVFATTIILTLACCRCLRRCCIRRRLRKKVLPDSVKNLRPSDRARLLAESSDDEF